MSYKPSAAKALRKLHPTEQKRIVRAIEALSGTPRPPGAIQLAVGDGELRIRVGDHRISYDIEDDALAVLVLRIGHRGDVYK
ncbi:type II toxin-antitoxin system RelE family toxin [Dietzia cinnamea]|uniref:type II toxin-antitoxin system RelE family toxin n=1 Tax=Dietzia cinnamea TaxID=321318 RepID=UPI00215AD392